MENRNVIILINKMSDNAMEDELDVLDQANLVSDCLQQLGYEPHLLSFSIDIKEAIESIHKINPLFVFNLVEGLNGKGELLYFAPAILDTLKVPYTGFSKEALFLTTSKILTKKQLNNLNIRTAEWFTIRELSKLDPNEKYILKPIWEEGSVGIDEENVFTGGDQIYKEKIKKLNHKEYYIERFIDGREFNISVLGGNEEPEVMPPAEIIFEDYPPEKHKVVGYKAKWKSESFEYNHTPRTFDFVPFDKPLLDEIRQICIKCWKEMNFTGYARIDFRVDNNNIPYLLEINGNPCITPDGGFYSATRQGGYTFTQVVERIIKDAMK